MDPLFLKTILLTLVAVAGATLGETMLSVGMRQIGEAPPLSSFDWRAFLGFYVKAFASPWIIGGIACLAIYFFTFLQLVSWADLSLVLPMTALTFILATVLARFWIHEHVPMLRWIGTLVIVLGVALVASTGAENVSSLPSHAAAPADPGAPPAR